MFFPEKNGEAEERKRRKQMEYHAALDRDAHINLEQGGIRETDKLPRLDAKRNYVDPPRRHDPTLPAAAELQTFVEKLNTIAKSVMENDRRLLRVERSVQKYRGGDQHGGAGDMEANAMTELELASSIRDFNKAKVKIDELQSILAAEIKSRNSSEDALMKQIAMAKSNQGDDGGSLSLVMGRVDAIGDQIRTMQDVIESEKISVNSLREKLSVITGNVREDTRSQLQDLMQDINSSSTHQQSAKEERKQLAESIQKLESHVAEDREVLRSLESKVTLVEEDGQKSVERLKLKLVDELQHMRDVVDAGNKDLQELLLAESNSRSKSIRNVREDLEDLDGRIHNLDNTWQSSFNEGFRGVTADLRNVKDANTASLQELREVLSAEITSRRKTAGKISTNIESLNSLSEKNTSDLHALAGEVEERFSLLDANLCKVTTSFSDQVASLQTATKSAVRTLQSDQKKIASRLDGVAEEQKSVTDAIHELIKKQSDRQNRMEAAFNERLSAMDNTIAAMASAIESKHDNLESMVVEEASRREESRKDLERNLSDRTAQISAQLEEVKTIASYNLTVEAQTRAHMIHAAEKKLSELMERDRADAAREMKALEAQTAANLSYALASEGQARAHGSSQLESKIKDGERNFERKLLTVTEDMKNSVSYAMSIEAQTRAHCINSLEGRIKESMHVRALDFAGEVQAVQSRLLEQSQALASNIITVESRLSQSLDERYEAISTNVKSIDSRMSEETSIKEALASTGSTLEKKLTDTRDDLFKSKKETDELRNALESFKQSWTKETLEHQERVQAMQTTIEDLRIAKDIGATTGENVVLSDGDMKALVEVTKVKHVVKELSSSWKDELHATRASFLDIREKLGKCTTHQDIDELEVRYTLDRLVSDVVQENRASLPSVHVTDAVEQIAKVCDSVHILSKSCDTRFESTSHRIEAIESDIQVIHQDIPAGDEASKQYANFASANVTAYVDENISDVMNKEVVSATLGFIVDNVVESNMVASIDDSLDDVRMELKVEILEHIQKVLSEPLYDLQNRQRVTEEKLGEYDIAYIQKQLRDFERSVENLTDDIDTIKTDVNDDLKERIVRVAEIVERLSK